jgi:hypothetical protein
MIWTLEKLDKHYKQQIDQWEKSTLAIGKNELLNHFRGEKLTRQDAIKAHCYQCMGGYGDGEERNCQNPPCPLYDFHPYNPNKPKMNISTEERSRRRKNMTKIISSRK